MMDSAPKSLFLPKEKENRLFIAKKEQVETHVNKEHTMKVRKALSGILLGLGCAIAFIGLLAIVLPAIPNKQLHLVLASFDMPSSHPLVSAMNTGMSFALRNGWQVLFWGLFLLMIGVALFVLFSIHEPKRRAASAPSGRSEEAFPSQPLWEPHPEPRPNPFADMAKWDSFAPLNPGGQEPSFAFARYRSPLLEPNRVEEVPVPERTPFESEPSKVPPPVLSWEDDPAPDANPFARPASQPAEPPAPDVLWERDCVPEPKADPLENPVPEPDDDPFENPATKPDDASSSQPAWEPALKPLSKPEPPKLSDVPSDHMTFGRSLVRSTFPQPEPPASPEAEPTYTPNEEEPTQPSSRIRSTMGRHREW